MVCRDFSERKKMELQLQHFNKELEDQVMKKTAELTGIFERITDAFIALDKNSPYTLSQKSGRADPSRAGIADREICIGYIPDARRLRNHGTL